MSKVGLLTWTTYKNYGTYLQWYALTKQIEEFGYDCTAINYIPKKSYQESLFYLAKNDFPKFIKLVNSKIDTLINKKEINLKGREVAFDSFRDKYFKLTQECITASDLFSLNKQFDTFVCGSDQIWSPLSFNSHFYLDFVQDKYKKIAYAPSMGVSFIDNEEKKKQIKSWLSEFEYISIREKAGQNIIKELIQKEVPITLDPTLLINENEWEKVINKQYAVPDNYILCYFLGQNRNYWKKIYQFSKKNKLQVVIIPVFKCDLKRFGIVKDNIGPAEFLKLVKNASFVCTDSFHGTVFSLLFKKKVAIFKRFKQNDLKNQNSRIENIISIFNLDKLVFSKKNNLNTLFSEKFDFDQMYSILNNERLKSSRYLKYSLQDSIQHKTESIFRITNTCCGCGACAAVCSKNAIKIILNEKGFYSSLIDYNLCVECRKCQSVCPYFMKEKTKIDNNVSFYSAITKNKKTLQNSSSGGIGFELMNLFKKQKLAVAGCYYDNKSEKAISTLIDYRKGSEIDISNFQGSKYLQSDFSQVFKQIDNVFGGIITGLPCQIAAVNNYLLLKNRRKDFLLVELICHGVPTSNLWKKYLSERYNNNFINNKTKIIFRDKSFGWHKKVMTFYEEKASLSINSKKDFFYNFFDTANCYNYVCYECNYRQSSLADLRIGDYWGTKFKNNNTGVSMVLALTEDGTKYLNFLSDNNEIEISKENINDYFKYQQIQNTFIPLYLDDILLSFNGSDSLKKLSKKYCSNFLKEQRLRKFVKKVLK